MKCYRDSMEGKLWTLMGGALLVGTLLLGCHSSPRNPGVPEAKAALLPNASEAEAVPPSGITLVPGDVIEVKFFHTPELNETQTVGPDGCIALQLIREVKVQGWTPAVLEAVLLGLYAPHLKDPDIVVIVRSFQNRRVFVGGQVMTPGIIQMPGELTVLDAIMEAGGFDLREAEVRNVVVIRHKDDRRYAYAVNLEPALKGDGLQSFFLEPQDIVYVPRTKIAKVDQWVDQHINRLIPRAPFYLSVPVD